MSVEKPMSTDESLAALRLRLFGRFEAVRGNDFLEMKYRRADRLLAYLVVQGGRAERGEVAAVLWPDAGSNPLDHGVAELRRQLGPDARRLESAHGFLRFNLSDIRCDLRLFDQNAAAMMERSSLQVAIENYSGPLLPHWNEPSDHWIVAERQKRQEQFRSALWRLALETRRGGGDAMGAAFWLRRYVAEFPREERGWQMLVSTLHEAGERLEAMETFEIYRRNLYGKRLLPPPEMERLYQDLIGTAKGTERAAEVPTSGGAMPPSSALYVERPVDKRLQKALEQNVSIVLVRGSRETGKSSLIAHSLARAAERHARVLFTDFQAFAREDIESMEALCRSLVAHLAAQLSEPSPGQTEEEIAPPEVFAPRPLLPPGVWLEGIVERAALRTLRPVVWAMDSVDRLFESPCRDDFFALLRSWHDRRSYERHRSWKRLSLVVGCATEPRLFIRDLNQSPFNVGVSLDLIDFDREQVGELHTRYGEPLGNEAAVDTLYSLLGGHPYLTGRAFRLLTENETFLSGLLTTAADEEGPFSAHLRRIYESLQGDSALSEAVLAALQRQPVGTEAFYRLRSAGILSGESSASPSLRCGLYETYLRKHL